VSLSVRGALVWSFAERYASLVVTVASTMVLARLLTPLQVGIFSLCAAVTAVAGILRDFGVSEYLIQEKDLTRDKLRAAFGIAIVIGWTIGAVVFGIRGLVASYFNEPGVAEVLAVLSLNFLILPFASPAFALLSRDMAFKKIFVVQLVSNTVQSATAVGLAYAGFGYMSLAWAPVAGIVVQTVLVSLFRPADSFLLPSLKNTKGVLQYGSMFVTSRTIETMTRNAHEFVIAKQFGFASVGLFSRAFGLLELFYNNVSAAILRVATPSFANDYRAGHELGHTFARGTAIFTCIAWPFFVFIALMSKEIVNILFGSQWDEAAPIASILAIAMMPSYLFILGPNLLAATGHVAQRLTISTQYSIVHLIGIITASFFGLKTVAVVWGISQIVMLFLYTLHLQKILKMSARQLYCPSFSSVWISIVCATLFAIATWVCRTANLSKIVTLPLVATVGLTIWLIGIKIMQHPVYFELKKISKIYLKS
jgi:O-antigen/teichoic acid export membrane protein